MNPEIVPIHRKEFLREDGMLFVRTESIIETMVKAPLIIASLIIVALAMPIQTSFSSARTLDLTLYSDGSAHVSSQLDVDPLNPDYEVNLFGPSIDNFVAVGENGFLLSSEIIDDKATIDTFGTSSITIDYDIHDLISKEGRVWTFSLDSPTDYSLLMPQNSIIVGMNALPSNLVIINDQTQLELSTGLSEINYILGTINPPVTNPPVTNPPVTNPPVTNPPVTNPPVTNPPVTNPPVTNPEQTIPDIFTISIIGISIISTVIGAIVVIKRKQTKSLPVIQNEITESETKINFHDPETIFNLRPEMREDDKEIIKFISENGGQVLESDLRKKFLQPRTTMWRAVKRLERQGVIEIAKKDLQNLVKIKKELEEEE
ncbi:MAG: MarR family transcriptional regulator [Nitrosopumilus sp.]|nr:MarR family transcriptional regulator [Nitrosopumilus sp.]